MKKTLLIFIFMTFFYQIVFTQNVKKTYLDRITVGTSLTVIPNESHYNNFSNEVFEYPEYTWNTNLAIDITRSWRMGFQYMAIYPRSKFFAPQQFFIAGTFLQFNMLPKNLSRNRVYLEASYNLGNKCSCGNFEPYKVDNIRYWGLGFGVDLKLTNWLRLDIGFFNYQIFNKIDGKYNWTQYIVGLEFPISIKKK